MNESETEAALLSVDLKEIELIFAQHHVRMQIIAQLTSISVALAGALVAAIATIISTDKLLPLWAILAAPIPFLLFGLLILREDLLMVSGDFYLYRLRIRLLKRVALHADDMTLSYLPEIKDAKMGTFSFFLSVLRYCPPFLALGMSLIWAAISYCCASKPEPTSLALGITMIGLNVILAGALIYGMKHVGYLHKKNEELAPPRRVV